MEFFDSLISEVSLTLGKGRSEFCPYDCLNVWQQEDYSHVILQRDTVCELEGTGFNLVTSSPVESGVYVIGDEIDGIKGKRRFARICVVQIESDTESQKNYNLIRKIDYIKYHFFPVGYMIRTSSRAHKEGVRVSRMAVKEGISFGKIGNTLIKKYLENPSVKGVRVYFVTDENIDFEKIEALAEKSNGITETLNHIMNSVKFDCDTCNLKPVCDEVEGMKELHFRTSGMGEYNG